MTSLSLDNLLQGEVSCQDLSDNHAKKEALSNKNAKYSARLVERMLKDRRTLEASIQEVDDIHFFFFLSKQLTDASYQDDLLLETSVPIVDIITDVSIS